ncbi:MAG: recombinase family protein [Clostridiales bacterium]|nr:recombinase family protein [Clostridiales bacterium]
MKRAVGYFRVSTNKEEQKQSLFNQKALFLQFIKDNDYSYNNFYVDVQTGTATERKNLIKMLDDAEKDLFDIIIYCKRAFEACEELRVSSTHKKIDRK